MDDNICLRCNGRVLKDLAGEAQCVNCGWEQVYSVPITATPNNFYASLPPLTSSRRGAMLPGANRKRVMKSKQLQVTEEEGTTPVKSVTDTRNTLEDAA